VRCGAGGDLVRQVLQDYLQPRPQERAFPPVGIYFLQGREHVRIQVAGQERSEDAHQILIPDANFAQSLDRRVNAWF
jgi:hypothetical protein